MARIQVVGCSVMSVTQSSLTRERWNLRFTRSSAVGLPFRRFTRVGPGRPPIPASVINTDTRRVEQAIPMPMVSSA